MKGVINQKRVINNLTYNTETAEEIARWRNGLGGSDFRSCSEQLYRTKKGNYFVAGEGGPMTQWRYDTGNGYCEGSGIHPVTVPEAIVWCEDHEVDADTILKHFDVEDA